jgi:16S rRNA (adenine1518-N6/adenine1519-N6)-dimethyltransferase
MKLSEMRDLLASRGIQLTRSLGQNFLHDSNQLQRIVSLAEVSQNDKVLEIGPGLGPLTQLLLDRGASILAIEKDKRLYNVLKDRFQSSKELELLHEDALEFLKTNKRDWSGWKLVSNLPYSVASPILVELATLPLPPKLLVATLQWEVVQRIMAKTGDDDYGQLSLFLQLRYQPGEFFKVPAGSFFPPPDVDSACIKLVLREKDLLPSEEIPSFYRIVKRAFGERRKMMFKLLKSDWPLTKLELAYEQIGISPQARAESLSLEVFVQLTKILNANDKIA